MKLLNRINNLLRNVFRRKKVEDDLNEEVDAYLEMLIQRRLERGAEPEAARREALIEFGGTEQVKEKVREVSMGHYLETIFQDLRYGVRMLAKSPVFTAVAVLTLALGIGANTAIFSVINGVLLRPLPYPSADRLVRIWDVSSQSVYRETPVSPGSVTEYRKQSKSFDGIAAYFNTSSVLTGDFEPEEILGASVSANLFSVMGFSTELGRVIAPEEDAPGQNGVVVLGHQLWQRRFGADPAIIGQTITLDHTNKFTVIGVMPTEFSYPGKSEFWIPLAVKNENQHDTRRLGTIARIKPGVTFQQAESEIKLINERLHSQFPKDYEKYGISVMPLYDSIVGKIRPTLLVLFGAVGFVLLIACANVANLMLSRAVTRQKEIAVRAALGAGRMRLIRQMLTENLLLSVVGGGGGLLLAHFCVKALVALNPPDLVRLNQIRVDDRVLAFTLVTSLFVGVIFGLLPAIQSSHVDVNHALKDGTGQNDIAGGLFSRHRLRGALVVIQTASAIILLVGAGLMIKSFNKLHQIELGFDPSNVITLTVMPAFNRLPDDQRMSNYYRQIIDSIKTTPGVSSVAAVTGRPLGGFFFSSGIDIAGRPSPEDPQSQRAFFSVVSSDYFRTIATPLRQGRYLGDEDREGSQLVAVINETTNRLYFNGTNPIGQFVSVKSAPQKQYQIVGVVADIKQVELERPVDPMIYFSMGQYDVAYMNFVVHSATDIATLLPMMRDRIRTVDKFAPINNVKTLDKVVYDSMAQPRFYTLLLSLFAGIAAILASIGLYGMMSYSVSQRRREIGIRLSLGAQPRAILKMVVGQGLMLIALGTLVGLGGAFGLTRLISKLLYNVSTTDPLTFAGVAVLLVIVAFLACYIPARRAMKVDPMVALRYE